MWFWISLSKQKTYLDGICAAHPSENIWMVSIFFYILDRRNCIKKSTRELDLTLDLSLPSVVIVTEWN